MEWFRLGIYIKIDHFSHIALGKWPNIYDNHLVIYRMGNLFISLLLLLFSHAVICDSLWPCGLQHARPPCSLPFPEVCPSSRLLHQWCHPAISSSDALFSFCPQGFPAPGTFPMSQLAVHSRWPEYWSFSFSPSNEYSGLISVKIDWFDLFAVQGTLRSLLQHHSLKASILWCSSFFMVQLSQPHDWEDHRPVLVE